ncbi:MAG: aminomethyl-transferring glycine dehydrogenase [Acidimicrobiales bacterium]|nr:aminomethyl-transferring glycine dehydrogenase [Acidimicrobiales bacterium]
MAHDATPSLDTHGEFVHRHIGPAEADVAKMLATVGFDSIDALIDAVVPDAIRERTPLELPAAQSEVAVLDELRALAERNEVNTSLIGLGYAGTITPPVILRNVLENPGWYTAYTPYQPEISQGRLEALVNFQTMVCDLTGMQIANASLLDEGTAAAEAMAMCHRLNPKGGSTFVIDAGALPQTIEVVRTRARALGLDVVVADPAAGIVGEDIFGVLLQYPTATGEVRDDAERIAALHERGILVVVAADILGLVALRAPGEIGADIVVGTTQRFGVPLGFGGPHAGFLATSDAHKRTLPGRLAGVSVDTAGRPAYRLTLQTREQHIRRERATSNICTAQVLLAVMAGLYATYHGPDGLRAIAGRVHRLTSILATGLRDGGLDLVHDTWFDTVAVRVPGRAGAVVASAAADGINLRRVDEDTVAVALDETTTPEIVERVWQAFGVGSSVDALAPHVDSPLPAQLQRTSPFLTHPTFNAYHSETEMLRYLRRLMDRDLALDRAMIPLGSCTMKLNATAEMIPITWPGFGQIHPFAPLEQAQGWLEVFTMLEEALVEITGYDAVSLQPNAGSQGEYAGLLAIRAFHEANGDTARDVCLIPASAHGTNAASAAMAGMRVVVVACDDDGNVDLDDLRTKLAEHADTVSCVMVTYPSTHGVFEEGIVELCDLVHAAGGQVYLDGANLNALVGVARPGRFGADVSHINLHKTFCIPHGGGGPGVGPIGVRAHLAPYLPNHPMVPEAGPADGPGPISAAPWGSAGILPISLAYIMLMGPDGLTQATQTAILTANYIAARLRDHYPVLYSGSGGLVAHECILDLRPITDATGVSVDDVAKRLIDYGFHAPTMSFPVAGTLMVEATESESLAEVDRFCDAMIAIRDEIRRVEAGDWPVEDSPLRHAPHPAEDVLGDDWSRPYPRELGAYPVPALRRDKYWVPVSRIDNAYGDRNVYCSCPPLSAWE